MKLSKLSGIATIFFLTLATMFLYPVIIFSAPSLDECNALKAYVETLTDATFNKPITLVSTAWVPAAGSTPEHCVVKGRVFPETDVQVKLPTDWNKRYFQNGGGGVNGTINTSQLNYNLSQKYASAASTGGHDGSVDKNTEFGISEPTYSQYFPGKRPDGNIWADQMMIDFGHRSLMETYTLAHKIINYYYNEKPLYSYFSGFSNGGKEAIVVAQKYPELFDGIIAGNPAQSAMSRVWRGQAAINGQIFKSEKAFALEKAVYGKCDSVDGLIDGLIDDPVKCEFDPINDLPACTDESDVHNQSCFTLSQRVAYQKFYEAPTNSSGDVFHVAQVPGFEYLTNPTNANSSGLGSSLDGCPSCDLIAHWIFDPPRMRANYGGTWDFLTFNWDTEAPLINTKTLVGADGKTYLYEDEVEIIEPTSYGNDYLSFNMGGLGAFYAHGGKLIEYSGWADSTVPALHAIGIYEAALSDLGAAKTDSFFKLYMIPGMGHGSGIGCGLGTDSLVNALVDWREKGIAPEEIIGTRNATTWLTGRTRPICPYPQVAKYIGTGSIDEAQNFKCVETEKAHVTIEPSVLSLGGGKQYFEAEIIVPHQGDWRATSAVCEGALAKKLVRHGHTYTATFDKADLKNVTADGNITFAVSLFVERQGKHKGNSKILPLVFEGADTVNVIR